MKCIFDKPTLKNLSQHIGDKVYYVYALGGRSSLAKHTIAGKPYKETIGRSFYWFVPTTYTSSFDGAQIESYFSLKDGNVTRQRHGKNRGHRYNWHKVFYCAICAQVYLNKCLNNNINLQQYTTT